MRPAAAFGIRHHAAAGQRPVFIDGAAVVDEQRAGLAGAPTRADVETAQCRRRLDDPRASRIVGGDTRGDADRLGDRYLDILIAAPGATALAAEPRRGGDDLVDGLLR